MAFLFFFSTSPSYFRPLLDSSLQHFPIIPFLSILLLSIGVDQCHPFPQFSPQHLTDGSRQLPGGVCCLPNNDNGALSLLLVPIVSLAPHRKRLTTVHFGSTFSLPLLSSFSTSLPLRTCVLPLHCKLRACELCLLFSTTSITTLRIHEPLMCSIHSHHMS